MSLPLPFKMIQETTLEKWRAQTFWNKEPETIQWIKDFEHDSVFYDIGANIGIYSLYVAAIKRRMIIHAFEPHFANFDRLVENSKTSSVDCQIFPWNCAMGDRHAHIDWFAPDTEAGSTGGQVGAPVDEHGKRFEPKQKTDMIIWTVDELSKILIAPPNYIKIDIDGQELSVIKGMEETLKNPNLKSVLVEINQNKDEIINIFVENGFEIDQDLMGLPDHSSVRRKKQGITAENIIFRRDM